ncbi:MAG: DNA repair exonuclease [Burkholderiales bacterium]|nr:DNA repair exonuclease [Burkholderiales bacterium]
MPRFLHTADLQVGRKYSQFDPDDAVPIADERIAVVARIASLAAARKVDAVLVAGDVFDLQTVSDRVIRRLFAAMEGFTGPWVLIPGNHDAALAECVWTRAQRLGALPAHVRVALRPEVIELPSCNAAILAAPLSQRHTYNDTTEFFDAAETQDGWLRIGLAHGSVTGILPEGDYLALGDWHGFKQVNERCAYSGTPEQDRFRGNDPGFCLIVDVESGQVPRVEPIRVGRYRWREIAFRVAVESDVDAICATLQGLEANDVVQVRIEGRTDLAGQRRLMDALGQAHARVQSLNHDLGELRLLPTPEDIAALHADGYLAEVIAELRDAQEDDASAIDPRVAREALAILCTELDSRAGASK